MSTFTLHGSAQPMQLHAACAPIGLLYIHAGRSDWQDLTSGRVHHSPLNAGKLQHPQRLARGGVGQGRVPSTRQQDSKR
jgi:hypothetical protein